MPKTPHQYSRTRSHFLALIDYRLVREEIGKQSLETGEGILGSYSTPKQRGKGISDVKEA